MAAGVWALSPPSRIDHGPGYWARSFQVMVHWHLAALRMWLATLVAVQILSGLGFVLGISLFFAHIPLSAALFVSTGVPVITLITVSLILGPQLVAMQKMRGSYEFVKALPGPRSAGAMAWYSVTILASVPALAISLLVAQLRYDLPLHITLMVIPASVMVSFCATMLGYALAHAVRQPMTTMMLTQLLMFVVFGFAPVLYPAAQLPRWLVAINWWFPFRHMAVVMRDALAGGFSAGVTSGYVVLAVWSVVCAGLAGLALTRRT